MNISEEEVLKIFENSKNTINDSKQITDKILLAVDEIVNCIKNKNKIVIFGNGGSAADAQHMAAEFIGRYLLERQSFPAIALTTDSSILTAIGNDYDFDEIFSRQCEALVNKGDVVFAISTSGKSKNVIKGIKKSKENGAKIISITGTNGNDMEVISDIILKIPSENTPRIQEGHKVVIHIICELVEKKCK
jgi:D-sedoheptulose 7-phosphate isomerase